MNGFLNGTRSLLFGCVICLVQGFVLFQVPTSRVRVEFRLAEMRDGPGLTRVEVDNPPETIYLHKEPVITGKDIIEAHVRSESTLAGFYQVDVTFTKNGAERMAAATEPKKGYLAVLIDGKVVAVAAIANRIYDRVTIASPMTKTEEGAEHLASMLRQGSGAGH